MAQRFKPERILFKSRHGKNINTVPGTQIATYQCYIVARIPPWKLNEAVMAGVISALEPE